MANGTITVEGQEFRLGSEEATQALTERAQEAVAMDPDDIRAASDLNIPDRQPSARVDEEIARGEQAEEELQTGREVAEQAVEQRQGRVQDIVSRIRGMQGQKEQALVEQEEQMGLTEKNEKLDEVNQEIATLNKAHRERIQEIGTRPGATATQAINLQQAEKRRHAFNIANQQIIKSAVEGSIERIQNAAQRKVDLMFEDEEQELQLQRDFLTDNRQLLKEAQRERLNQTIKSNQTKLKRRREKAQTLESQKADILNEVSRNGASNATLRAINEAESIDEALIRAQGFLDTGATAGGTTGGGAGDDPGLQTGFETARQFVRDNPNASRQELEAELRARRDELGLNISDISAVIEAEKGEEPDFELTDNQISSIASSLRKQFQGLTGGTEELQRAKDFILKNRQISINGRTRDLTREQAQKIASEIDKLGSRTFLQRILPGGQ